MFKPIKVRKFEYITGWFSRINFDKADGNITIRFYDDLVHYSLKLKEKSTRLNLGDRIDNF
ncbi:RepB family plasmid replication initiator protein [Senegalia sp. (in: firmicutes)]|uniref:RepB family plasmid replication initiator protein n=1 Tax=Senegalia sp. (in: firmicutes) TaxID=1924098 RepID=UPI003F9A4DC4